MSKNTAKVRKALLQTADKMEKSGLLSPQVYEQVEKHLAVRIQKPKKETGK